MIDYFIKKRTSLFALATIVYISIFFVSLFLPHLETDEVIYQTLSKQLLHGSYSLQGTTILQNLPQITYNTPVFFHPVAFPLLLAVFYVVFGSVGFSFVAPLLFILITIFMYKTALLVTHDTAIAVKTFLFSLFSPMLLLTATKVHVDLFMTCMIVVSLYFLFLFQSSQKERNLIRSGLFLTLAVLTKYTAFIALPFFLFVLFKNHATKKQYGLFLIPFLLFAFWLLYLFTTQGYIGFANSAPTLDSVRHYSFLHLTVEIRQWYFYIVSPFLVNPCFLFLSMFFQKSIRQQVGKRAMFIFLCAGISITTVVAMTILGMRGYGFQMRYILPAEPFLLFLLALLPIEKNKIISSVITLFLFQNLVLFFYNAIVFQAADMASFVERLIYNIH